MQNKWVGILIMLVLALSGCSGDADLVKDPTPYALSAPEYFGSYTVPNDNPTTIEGVDLGRMLFYEPRLSQFDSISCGSCHQQEKAFTDSRALALGVPQVPLKRNTMSIANQLWETHFFWDGRVASLEDLVIFPLQDHLEMNQPIEISIEKLKNDPDYPQLFKKAYGDSEITTLRIVNSIAQFMRILISSDSKYDRYIRGEYVPTSQELRGIDLFFTHPVAETGLRGGNCGDCHSSFLTSGFTENFDGFHNNGLDTDSELEPGLFEVTGNNSDFGKFKTPTLRNIALTAPYMHDGRFQTLEEVLNHYNENVKESATLDVLIREASNETIPPGEAVKLHLTDQEKEDIIAFLNMLTDEKFISNEEFSDPFGNP